MHLARLLALPCVLLSPAALHADDAPPAVAVRAGMLLDVRSGRTLRDQVILVRGETIAAVRPAAEWDGRAGQVVDLSGLLVLPGLIDTHTHLFLQGEEAAEGGYDVQLLKQPLAYRAARATVAARRALEQGFTTIRDVETEGAGYGDVGIRMAVDEGHIPGPRIFASTRGISTTGGYNLEGYAPEIQVPKGVQLVDGPVQARQAAREQLEHGADWIKVYMTHRAWVDDSGNLASQPTLTVDELKAIVDEAHGWGKHVACHAYNGTGLQRALDGGCDSIEHGLELTDANVAQMVRQGTWLVPTMVAYTDWAPPDTAAGRLDRKRAEVHVPSLARAYKAGVKIAFGSDVGGFKWDRPIAREFEQMVKAGVTPLDAIRAATSRAAELLGLPGKLGTVAPGAFADLVAFEGDPLANVNVLLEPRFVMKGGRVFKRD